MEKLNFEKELADIQQQSAESLRSVQTPDFTVDLSEWLTVKRYADKYGVSQQVVVNWISRGIVPADCVMEIPELNNIRLVKNQPYR